MRIKIKLYSVNTDSASKNMILKAKIAPTFRLFSELPPVFEEFPSFSDLLPVMEKNLETNDMVVIFASLTDYSSVKQLLISTMHLNGEINELVRSKIVERYGVDKDSPNVIKHALFPAESRVFESDDGVYCGFCCTYGKKYIMLLPFDTTRTLPLVKNDIAKTISSLSGIARPRDDRSIFNDVCFTLDRKATSVAVAGTQTAEFLRNLLSKSDSFKNLFRFDTPARERENGEGLEEYTADVAKASALRLSRLFGIATSRIVRDGAKKRTAVAVWSEKGAETAVIERVFSDNDEIPDYLSEVLNELLVMLKVKLEAERQSDDNPGDGFETL